MEAVTAVAGAAVIMAAAIVVVVMVMVTVTAPISAAGIMAAAIFTAEPRISAHSPDIVHSHTVRFPRNA